MRERELENFLKLSLVKGVGNKFLREFYNVFGTFGGNFEENLQRFLKEKGSSKRLTEILNQLKAGNGFSELWTFIKRFNVEVIPFYDPRYPRELETLGINAPALYLMGELSKNGFAIVGTRRASAEGKFKTREFAAELAGNGYTVISGGAEGIDRSAHEGALSVGGKTGVILGEGLAIFLKRNGDFARKVLKRGGFILSQFHPLTVGAKWTYPQRNALIAYFGFYGTLIVEAPERSGALITADYALKLKRPLFVYLNCVRNPLYAGNLKLIKECKAKLVTEPGEILSSIGDENPPTGEFKSEGIAAGSGDESRLVEVLRQKPRTFDELVALVGLPEEKLLEQLTLLELDGKVVQEGGFYRWVD